MGRNLINPKILSKYSEDYLKTTLIPYFFLNRLVVDLKISEISLKKKYFWKLY